MITVTTELTDTCAVCGEVACERDLLYVETEQEAEDLGVEVGGLVCRECAS